MTFDFSVVVCAYTEDRWHELLAAVASTRAQHLRPREIIVVIDHNPRLLSRTREAFPDLQVIENQYEHGLSGARNSGIATAGSELVAFIDEDAVAEPDWLSRLAQHYANERVMGVGGAIVPHWLSGRPIWFPEEFDWVVGCTYRGMPEEPAAVRNLIGCNMSFRRELFDVVGGFHAGLGRVGVLPAGCEETELCVRLLQHWPDCCLIYEPAARVRHRVPAARSRWQYFQARCYAEGRSKALVAELVGTRDGLATERTYTLHTLPKGVWRNAYDALRHARPSYIGRALAITLGLAVTTCGYSLTRLASRRRPSPLPARSFSTIVRSEQAP